MYISVIIRPGPEGCGKKNIIKIDLSVPDDGKKCPTGGYLVQRVDWRFKPISDCDECPDRFDPKAKFIATGSFYEWWSVGPGNEEPDLTLWNKGKTPDFAIDEMKVFAHEKRAGLFVQKRTIRFYCKTQTGDLGTHIAPNPPWKIGGDDQSGVAPSVTAPPDPAFWGKVPQSSLEYWTSIRFCCFFWKSCCPNNTRFTEQLWGSEAEDRAAE